MKENFQAYYVVAQFINAADDKIDWGSDFSLPLACHRLFPRNWRTLNQERKTLKRVSEHFMQGTKKSDLNWSSYFSSLYASMRSPLQAFLLITSSIALSPLSLLSNQTEVVDGQEGRRRTTSGDLNTTQVAQPHLAEVTNSTTDLGVQSLNSSKDSTANAGGQSKNSSDKSQARKALADTLAMMPESLVGAGDKARLWLNQNNQMVSSV